MTQYPREEVEFDDISRELPEYVARKEDRTILHLKPEQKMFLIEASDNCIADKNCINKWNKDLIKNTACQLAAGLGKKETKLLYPNVDNMCSSKPDTFFFFLDKELNPVENELLEFVQNRYRDYKREIMSEVILKDRKIIGFKEVSVGTLSSALIHPREIFYEAVNKKADQVLLFHNHPSGDVKPSAEDLDITDRLKRIGEMLGIEVIDHVIVGDKIQKMIDYEKEE